MQQMVLNGCSQSLVGLTFTASQAGSMGFALAHLIGEIAQRQHYAKENHHLSPAPVGNSATIRATSRCGLEAKPRPAFNAIWAQICVENGDLVHNMPLGHPYPSIQHVGELYICFSILSASVLAIMTTMVFGAYKCTKGSRFLQSMVSKN